MSELIDKTAVVLKADGALKSYEQVYIMEVFSNGNVKVMDAAINVHMTALSNLRIEEN